MRLYKVYNGPRPTTAALASVTTGTAIKTLLQVSPPSTEMLKVIEWGISFDGVTASNAPIKCELVETDVAATVTAYVANDIVKVDDPNAPATNITLGTANSGYTASGEGTVAATRVFDAQLISPTASYAWAWPLGREPVVNLSKFLRIRVTAAVAVNAYCYVAWEE